LHAQDEKLFWHSNWENSKNSFWQISAHKFGLNFVGEIEWQNFCRTLSAGKHLLGAQRLVKLAPTFMLPTFILPTFIPYALC